MVLLAPSGIDMVTYASGEPDVNTRFTFADGEFPLIKHKSTQ